MRKKGGAACIPGGHVDAPALVPIGLGNNSPTVILTRDRLGGGRGDGGTRTSGVGRIRAALGVTVGDENLHTGRKDHAAGALGHEDHILFGTGALALEKNDGLAALKVECALIVAGGDFDVVAEVRRGEDGFGLVRPAATLGQCQSFICACGSSQGRLTSSWASIMLMVVSGGGWEKVDE